MAWTTGIVSERQEGGTVAVEIGGTLVFNGKDLLFRSDSKDIRRGWPVWVEQEDGIVLGALLEGTECIKQQGRQVCGHRVVSLESLGLKAHQQVAISAKKIAPLELGKSCEEDSECATGFCRDGVCCSTTSCDICNACNVEGHLGKCAPAPAGTSCGTASCSHNIQTFHQCTADGDCQPYSVQCPDNFACYRRFCSKRCEVDAQCAEGHSCVVATGKCDGPPRVERAGQLYIHVFDQNGVGAKNQLIYIQSQQSQIQQNAMAPTKVQTNAQGDVSLRNLAAGRYVISLSPKGGPSQEVTLEYARDTSFNFDPFPHGTPILVVRVLDASGGSLANATVRLVRSGPNAPPGTKNKTDSAGRVVFYPTSGQYDVSAVTSDGISGHTQVTLDPHPGITTAEFQVHAKKADESLAH